ncbi:MAG: helix-turn-helix transcriptional regulator, partial [Oscillospiraceae bacterium]|nr:helix-turn-helix transcriptional regulator [Oscillospiraceae bacterium]
MENIKAIVAKNITQLRLAKGMTQLELAEILNYSDKAVSKWERGDSIPDITVLTKIADMFGVTLDYLVRPHREADDSGM